MGRSNIKGSGQAAFWLETATGTFVVGAFGTSVFCGADTDTFFAVVFSASVFCGTDTGSVYTAFSSLSVCSSISAGESALSSLGNEYKYPPSPSTTTDAKTKRRVWIKPLECTVRIVHIIVHFDLNVWTTYPQVDSVQNAFCCEALLRGVALQQLVQ